MAAAGIPREHIAKVLNHVEGGARATRVYDRHSYDAEKAAEALAFLAGETGARRESDETVTVAMPRERVPEALAALQAAGVAVYGVEPRASSLEEVFLEVTGGETV